ncbi:MAG: hypothetical protein KJN62_00440 [Deltaproteobacteria bacterium]|nr:hypothetical protein [Deltaproteobacteria bacterium]
MAKLKYRDLEHPDPRCREWIEIDFHGCSVASVDIQLKRQDLEDSGWEVEEVE